MDSDVFPQFNTLYAIMGPASLDREKVLLIEVVFFLFFPFPPRPPRTSFFQMGEPIYEGAFVYLRVYRFYDDITTNYDNRHVKYDEKNARNI